MMRVVIKHPGKKAFVEEIDPGLDGLQKAVGGYIEQVLSQHDYFESDRLVIYGNEDGLRERLAYNLSRPMDGHRLVGNLLAVKVDASGENVAMTVEDAERVRQLFGELSPVTDT